MSVASHVGVYTITQRVPGDLLGSLDTFHGIDNHSMAYLRFLATSKRRKRARGPASTANYRGECGPRTPGRETYENLDKPILNLEGGSKSYEHKCDGSKTSLVIASKHCKLIPPCKAVFKKDLVSW